MTEDREKEIDVALWTWVILPPHERREKYKDLMKVIRATADESFRDGVKSMLGALVIYKEGCQPKDVQHEADWLLE